MVVATGVDFTAAIQEECEVATTSNLGDVGKLLNVLRSIGSWDCGAKPKSSLGIQTPRVDLTLSVDSDGVLPAARDLGHETVQ